MKVIIYLLFGLSLLLYDLAWPDLPLPANAEPSPTNQQVAALLLPPTYSSFFRDPLSDCDTAFVKDMIREQSFLSDKVVGKFVHLETEACRENSRTKQLYFNGLSHILANNIEGWANECLVKTYDLQKLEWFFEEYKNSKPEAAEVLEKLKSYIDELIDQHIRLNDSAAAFYADLYDVDMPEIQEEELDIKGLPNFPEPGKCYARCFVKDETKLTTDSALVNFNPSKPLHENPLLFQRTTIKVPIPRESLFEFSYQEDSYELKNQLILVREEISGLAVLGDSEQQNTQAVAIWPAGTLVESVDIFETTTETVVTADPNTQWVRKVANKSCVDGDPNDCFVLCLVEVPAQYQAVIRKVNMGFPAGTTAEEWVYNEGEFIRKIADVALATKRTYRLPTELAIGEMVIPAEFATVQRKMLVAKGNITKLTKYPSEYTLVSSQFIDHLEMDKPTKMVTFQKKKVVKPGGLTEWREIHCDASLAPDIVSRIQQALIDKGYDLPRFGVTNEMNQETKSTLIRFQKENNLPVGNLDAKTLQALGIDN